MCMTTVLLTCRQCGHHDTGTSEGGLMNRIKMWNHVNRSHADRNIKASEVRLLIREDNQARIEEEAYRLQASY